MNPIISSYATEQPALLSQGNNEFNVAIAGLALGGAESIVLDWATRIYPKWRVHVIVLRDCKTVGLFVTRINPQIKTGGFG